MSEHHSPHPVQRLLPDIVVAENSTNEPSMVSPPATRRTKLGKSRVEYKRSRSILSKASGFISAFDYTLNPYSGCTFGCSYCYAAFFARDREKLDNWGYWVQVKENALDLLRRKRKRTLKGKTIYMSSVTDPYQPIERELELTRQILQQLLTYEQVRLVIQTRSPIVTRDIDLLQEFEAVQVNMSITTDDETVRRVFEPLCSSIRARLQAITVVHEAGIPTCITLTPLLPVTDADAFAQKLLATQVPKFVVQFFQPTKGRFVAGTRQEAVELSQARNWNQERYQQVLHTLKRYIPHIYEGKKGFTPI